MKVLAKYENYTDRELVTLIVKEHVHEALIYLLYDRYYNDAKFYAFRYYGSLEYIDDLMEDLTVQLMGKNGDYSPLASYKGRSTFRTWLSRVISNLFIKKLGVLTDFEINRVNNNDDCINNTPETNAEDLRMVLLLEAIARLEDQDKKFVLIKELEGYKPKEIAQMIQNKWQQDNIVRYDNKKNVVVPSAEYVHTLKSRALKEVKTILETLKY